MNGMKSSSTIQQILELLDDYIELGTLECRYEGSQARRRIYFVVLGAVLGLTAFVLVQVAAVHGLLQRDLPLRAICLLAATGYGILSVCICRWRGRRDPSAGKPFQASSEEFRCNLQWIRQNLS